MWGLILLILTQCHNIYWEVFACLHDIIIYASDLFQILCMPCTRQPMRLNHKQKMYAYIHTMSCNYLLVQATSYTGLSYLIYFFSDGVCHTQWMKVMHADCIERRTILITACMHGCYKRKELLDLYSCWIKFICCNH